MVFANPLKVKVVPATQAGSMPLAELSEAPNSFEHYQAAMLADMNQLKQLKDIKTKAAAKITMLKQYMGFVNAYVTAKENYPNSVAVQCAIWLFDVGDIKNGLNLILHLIKQGIHHTPFNFQSTLEVFCCDYTYDFAAAQLRKTPPETASPFIDTVVATLGNDHWNLPVAVESKMYVMLAKHKKLAGEFEVALSLCDKAVAVNPMGAGVKRLTEELDAAIRKHQLLTPGQAIG